jgi:hypothetical protein
MAKKSAMDAGVRQALHNLQGMLDEGFIAQGEFNTRRKKIIDGATSLPTNAAGKQPAAGSVFDRLGTAPVAAGSSDPGAWAHDGFTDLYGAAAGRKAAGGKAARHVGKYQPPAARGAIGKRQVTVTGVKGSRGGVTVTGVKGGRGGDLRSRIGGGGSGDLRSKIGNIGGGRARCNNMPEKCPW